LALAIEAKDQTTHDHLQRVRIYAIEVAKELGIKGAELEALHAAALLHDIGKLAVPEHIISKPGRLTPEEFEKMKIHTVVGAEILERVRFPYPVVPIVRAHHEKWDGSGYPIRIKGHRDSDWRAHPFRSRLSGCLGVRPAIPARHAIG
jgi:putative nucleotidyltransferase with HDIG domain